MPKDETMRLLPAVLAEDQSLFESLDKVSFCPGSDEARKIDELYILFEQMLASQAAEAEAEAALEAAHEDLANGELAFHNAVAGAKAEVIAQFGEDSDEARLMGIGKPAGKKKRTR